MTLPINRYSFQAHRRAQSVLATASRTRSNCVATAEEERLGLSVLLLNKDSPDYIEQLLPQLVEAQSGFHQQGLYFEVLIGDTGSTSQRTLTAYQVFQSRSVRVIDVGPYHFSANNNTLVYRHAQTSAILCLNNDIELPDPSLLYDMYVSLVSEPASVRGAQLLYPDGSVQHGGVGFLAHDQGIFAYHLRHRQQPEWSSKPQPVSALTGALLMLRRQSFLSVGGFDPAYTDECQDIDLCLKLQRLGHAHYLHAHCSVVHHENGTRVKGEENWTDRSLFNNRWRRFLEIRPELLPQ